MNNLSKEEFLRGKKHQFRDHRACISDALRHLGIIHNDLKPYLDDKEGECRDTYSRAVRSRTLLIAKVSLDGDIERYMDNVYKSRKELHYELDLDFPMEELSPFNQDVTRWFWVAQNVCKYHEEVKAMVYSRLDTITS